MWWYVKDKDLDLGGKQTDPEVLANISLASKLLRRLQAAT